MGKLMGDGEGPKVETVAHLRSAGSRAIAAISVAYAAGTLLLLSAYWTGPELIDDDARTHLLGFYAQRMPDVFADRFLSDYALGYVPPGYRALFSVASQAFDPLAFSKFLGAVLLLTSWALSWLIGRRLGGRVGAAGALLLSVHCGFLLLHTFGGLHRGFGFPLVLAFVWAWIERKDIALAFVLLAQALVYPPMFLVCWSAVAIRIAASPIEHLGPRRTGLVAQVGASLLAALFLLSFSRQPEEWGQLATLEQAAAMGEFQRDGGRIKLLPLLTVSEELTASVERSVAGLEPGLRLPIGGTTTNRSLSLAALLVLGLTVPGFFVARPRPYWAAALFVSAIGVHLVARRIAFRIGEPDRALKYAIPVLVILAWPLAWGATKQISNVTVAAVWRVGLSVALAMVFVTLGLGLRDIGEHVVDARGETALHAAIGRLDAFDRPVLIAGWPDGPIDNVPLIAGREIFVDHEHAHPLYLSYYAEVRLRIEDTLKLIYATDVQTVREIRDHRGVTHLILERSTLEPDADRPQAISPTRQVCSSAR